MMLAEAGKNLDISCTFIEPADNPPAAKAGRVIKAAYDDTAALDELMKTSEVITYEFENVPAAAAQYLSRRTMVLPHPMALEKAQDRLSEKNLFEHFDVPVPRFAAVDTLEELEASAVSFGFPCVLKTRRMGYDGKGQIILKTEKDCGKAWKELKPAELILEAFVLFDCEVSMIAVRGANNKCEFYPLFENTHREGILRMTVAPSSKVTPELQKQAEEYAEHILKKLMYVGVLTIEFFVQNGKLLANEMAPRVHNSGHLTIEGSETSQFENHMRAVLGLPLGPVKPKAKAVMINCIGSIPNIGDLAKHSNIFVHDYGKTPKPNRKVGHITIVDDGKNFDEAVEAVRQMAEKA